MELRNGKKYFFKHKPKKEVVPEYVKNTINYLKADFARAGLEIIQTDYRVIKYKPKRRPKRK